MKAENLMDAIGNLDESLLAESLPKKRRNFRPLAAVAIGAAVAYFARRKKEPERESSAIGCWKTRVMPIRRNIVLKRKRIGRIWMSKP